MDAATPETCCCGPVANYPDVMKGDTPSKVQGQTHDPVCGMLVDPVTAKNRADHDCQTYYFCCGGCKVKFLAEPAQYLTSDAKPPPAVPAAPSVRGTIYTCPMHPQIRRNAPGSCPICGMALEPEGIPEAEGTNPELKDMTRRFVIGAVLATPIFVLEMGGHLAAVEYGSLSCPWRRRCGFSSRSQHPSCCGARGPSSSEPGRRS